MSRAGSTLRSGLVLGLLACGPGTAGDRRPDDLAWQIREIALPSPDFTLRDDGDRLFVRTEAGAFEAVAQDGGVELVSIPALPPDAGAALADRLPDSVPAFGRALTRAWLAEPTDRYAHAVLGDDLEAAAVRLELDGTERRIGAGAPAVFEDLRPRLVDFDGDGVEELVVVRSDAERGAAPVVYRSDGSVYAEGPATGQAFRWLCPVGAADLDRREGVELAWVVRPHLDATLTVATVTEGRFDLLDAVEGYSNHRLGSTFVQQSTILGDVLVVPSKGRRRLAAVVLVGGRLEPLAEVDLAGTLASDVHRFGEELLFAVEAGEAQTLMGARLVRP